MNEVLSSASQLFGYVINGYESFLNVIYYIPILDFYLGDIMLFFGIIALLFFIFLGGDNND